MTIFSILFSHVFDRKRHQIIDNLKFNKDCFLLPLIFSLAISIAVLLENISKYFSKLFQAYSLAHSSIS